MTLNLTNNQSAVRIEEMSDILTVKDVAEFLKLSYKTTLQMIHNKTIPAVKVSRQYRCYKADVLEMVGLEEV